MSIRIDGVVEGIVEGSDFEDEFLNKFIEFVESLGLTFTGATWVEDEEE